jgi:hypothetical protein
VGDLHFYRLPTQSLSAVCPPAVPSTVCGFADTRASIHGVDVAIWSVLWPAGAPGAARGSNRMATHIKTRAIVMRVGLAICLEVELQEAALTSGVLLVHR